jgi:hypothetical protein
MEAVVSHAGLADAANGGENAASECTRRQTPTPTGARKPDNGNLGRTCAGLSNTKP